MTYGGSRRPDLAARLRRGQRVLKSRLERPESVLALLRAAHESLEPESIGKLVVNRAEEWFKASACGVFAADLDGQVAGLASKGIGESLSPAALGVARWVLGHGRDFASADLRKDPRAMGAAGAVLAWPLRCRAQTVAALVVMERQAATHVPQVLPATGQALGAILEGPAQALDNALRLRRSEALSVTDRASDRLSSSALSSACAGPWRMAPNASATAGVSCGTFVDAWRSITTRAATVCARQRSGHASTAPAAPIARASFRRSADAKSRPWPRTHRATPSAAGESDSPIPFDARPAT